MLTKRAIELTSKFSQFRSLTTSSVQAVRRNNATPENQDFGEKLRSDFVKEAATQETVLKVVQRFKKDPQSWPKEDQPFGVVEKRFIGRTMDVVELRPERGFANFVPFGFMTIRHIFRRARSQGNYMQFKPQGIFDEQEDILGTKKAFELIAQNGYKNTLGDLAERGVCSPATVARFEGAGKHMSERQRSLLNLKEEDVYAIAPGVLNIYQNIRPILHEKSPFMARSVLCCAFYKKQVLFDAVKDLPLLEKPTEEDQIAIPSSYGYDAPRLIMGYITFGNQIIKPREFDPEVKLIDFQFLVL